MKGFDLEGIYFCKKIKKIVSIPTGREIESYYLSLFNSRSISLISKNLFTFYLCMAFP